MTLPDPPPQPPEPTRIPSTLGGLVYLGVCLVTAVGLLVVAFGPWRRGIALIGVALVIAAGMRSFLSEHDSGMLRVRSRWFDVVALAGVGIAMIVLAINIPNQS